MRNDVWSTRYWLVCGPQWRKIFPNLTLATNVKNKKIQKSNGKVLLFSLTSKVIGRWRNFTYDFNGQSFPNTTIQSISYKLNLMAATNLLNSRTRICNDSIHIEQDSWGEGTFLSRGDLPVPVPKYGSSIDLRLNLTISFVFSFLVGFSILPFKSAERLRDDGNLPLLGF